MNILVTLEVPKGCNIQDICEEALILAKAYKGSLTFEFNKHKIYVSPDSTQENLLRTYNRLCDKSL